MPRTKSICSSVVATAASPASVTGTNTDQNCAPSLPCASLGRSVLVKLERRGDVGPRGVGTGQLAEKLPGEIVVAVDERGAGQQGGGGGKMIGHRLRLCTCCPAAAPRPGYPPVPFSPSINTPAPSIRSPARSASAWSAWSKG